VNQRWPLVDESRVRRLHPRLICRREIRAELDKAALQFPLPEERIAQGWTCTSLEPFEEKNLPMPCTAQEQRIIMHRLSQRQPAVKQRVRDVEMTGLRVTFGLCVAKT